MKSKPIPKAAEAILNDLPTGHLCTIRPDGLPSVNPVALLYDGEHVRVSTVTKRQKYKNLLADPRIAISVPHRNNPNYYIELRGHAELEPDPDRSFVNQIAKVYMGEDVYPFDQPGDERVTIKIIAEQVSMPTIPLAKDPPGAPDSPSS